MKSKAEYLALAEAVIAEYPSAALLYQVQDPRLLAMLGSMATMLAEHSMEQDVAAMEPWTKARDVTVLADAAVKGVLPFGTPMQISLTVENITAAPFSVLTGRRLLDQQGRLYVVTTGASIPANGTATVKAIQRSETVFNHTVTASQPFYRIDVPAPDIGDISGLSLRDSQANTYTYTPEFTNVGIGERIFHIESDENRQIYIVLGSTAVGGYQPSAGEVLSVTVHSTEGAFTLSSGAAFVFEYASTIAESGAKITLESVLVAGEGPMDIATMREVIRYPSLYDVSAVYLANFDFLLRRNLSTFRFLSVWNEQREEEVRGASQDNINTLFVAALKDGVDAAVLRADVERVIREADDSYRVRWVPVQESAIPVTINLKIPDVYDSIAVTQQARELVLAKYGRDSAWAKRGQGRVLYRKVTTLLEDSIQACQAADADVQVTVADDQTLLPETYRYVSRDSLVITVENTQ